jgi:hypothetical protein
MYWVGIAAFGALAGFIARSQDVSVMTMVGIYACGMLVGWMIRDRRDAA